MDEASGILKICRRGPSSCCEGEGSSSGGGARGHLEQGRAWSGRPLWEMQPADADVYFGTVLRGTARAQALKTFFLFLELRHKVEIHQMTGRVVERPIDEMNRPRARRQAKLRIAPSRSAGCSPDGGRSW